MFGIKILYSWERKSRVANGLLWTTYWAWGVAIPVSLRKRAQTGDITHLSWGRGYRRAGIWTRAADSKILDKDKVWISPHPNNLSASQSSQAHRGMGKETGWGRGGLKSWLIWSDYWKNLWLQITIQKSNVFFEYSWLFFQWDWFLKVKYLRRFVFGVRYC